MKIVDFEQLWICSILGKTNVPKLDVHLYLGLYESVEHVEEIIQSLRHFESGTPFAKLIVMPNMRYLVASHYNVVFIMLSL